MVKIKTLKNGRSIMVSLDETRFGEKVYNIFVSDIGPISIAPINLKRFILDIYPIYSMGTISSSAGVTIQRFNDYDSRDIIGRIWFEKGNLFIKYNEDGEITKPISEELDISFEIILFLNDIVKNIEGHTSFSNVSLDIFLKNNDASIGSITNTKVEFLDKSSSSKKLTFKFIQSGKSYGYYFSIETKYILLLKQVVDIDSGSLNMSVNIPIIAINDNDDIMCYDPYEKVNFICTLSIDNGYVSIKIDNGEKMTLNNSLNEILEFLQRLE